MGGDLFVEGNWSSWKEGSNWIFQIMDERDSACLSEMNRNKRGEKIDKGRVSLGEEYMVNMSSTCIACELTRGFE